MRALADTLCCDASMAAWLVDRLEERGLVQRQTPVLYCPPAQPRGSDTVEALTDWIVPAEEARK